MAIIQNGLFIGKPVLGSTAGAPLSSDANSLLVSGITNAEVVGTADITTTSATDVVATGITTTPVAGSYLVWFSTYVDHSNQNIAVTVSLYVGGAQITDSVRAPIPRTNAIGAITMSPCVSINNVVTVNGSQAIDIRWNRGSAGTATMHQRTLNVLRVS